MHAVGARALHSLARASPRHSRIPGRRLQLTLRRSFLSSPVRPARPDEPNASRDDNPQPEGAVDQYTEAPDGTNGAAAAEGPAVPPGENLREVLAVPGNGKSRVGRGRHQDMMPSVDLPEWFVNEHVRLHVRQDPATNAAEGLSRDDPGERLASRELYATLQAELLAVAPKNKQPRDIRRPVSVLAVVNYKGRGAATSVINQVAGDLQADVVHLDASSISHIVGTYLGQTAYWARGNLSMLGYTAAERNGRLAPRYEAKSDDDSDIPLIFSRVPAQSKTSSNLTARIAAKLFPAESEDRWDELKTNHVLEEIAKAADAMRRQPGSSAGAPQRLIVHVHNYVELNLLIEGQQLLGKLRNIVDRLWQRGREIVIVGSTSADMQNCPEIREKAEELRQEDCHIIPFHVAAEESARLESEQRDNFADNVSNIRMMVSALTGKPASLASLVWEEKKGEEKADETEAQEKESGDKEDKIEDPAQELNSFLSKAVYDIHWVYRFATLALGNREPASKGDLDVQALAEALRSIQALDKVWEDKSGAQEPYFSPLTAISAAADSTLPHEFKLAGAIKQNPRTEFNEYEKKFLSDLINAKDIKTTFDDIVLPPETKESLRALTSLSLIRPEAFLYGVLATERIPGCLLYGPPGTGKTLMAKAVAKQSGANMLEVSAASINDMWMGNSEKNVQALFSLARKLAPMVIFLDEADALLGARQARPGRGGFRETVNQFLREWDGLTDMKAFIMVATNRPFDLDEAVLRRLPRKILVDLPLRDARLAILRVMLRGEALDASVSLERLAAATELYSGSDLKNLCVAAAMEAVKEEVRARDAHTGPEPFVFPDRRVLTAAHFDRALREIGASISEDMSSLQAIRRFDERYGDAGKRRRHRHMGFGVAPDTMHSEEARVRQATTPDVTTTVTP